MTEFTVARMTITVSVVMPSQAMDKIDVGKITRMMQTEITGVAKDCGMMAGAIKLDITHSEAQL